MSQKKKISSSSTAFYKWGFPIIFLSFIAFIVSEMLRDESIPQEEMILSLSALAVIVFIAILSFKKFFFDALDAVYDHGDYFLLKKGGQEERLPLHKILNVNHSMGRGGPTFISLLLKEETKLGKEVSFFMIGSGALFGTPTSVLDLIERIEKARTANR